MELETHQRGRLDGDERFRRLAVADQVQVRILEEQKMENGQNLKTIPSNHFWKRNIPESGFRTIQG